MGKLPGLLSVVGLAVNSTFHDVTSRFEIMSSALPCLHPICFVLVPKRNVEIIRMIGYCNRGWGPHFSGFMRHLQIRLSLYIAIQFISYIVREIRESATCLTFTR